MIFVESYCRSKSPPCNINCGITRWNDVSL